MREIMSLRLEGKNDSKEMKNELRKNNEKVKKGMIQINSEIEEVKRELREKEKRWERERKEMMDRIKKLEEELDNRDKGKREEKGGEIDRKVGEEEGNRDDKRDKKINERMKRLERLMKNEERDKRKKNLIFKGVKGEGEVIDRVDKVGREIGVEIEIEEIKKIKTGREERGEMLLVKVKTEKNKRRIMKYKKKLKGRDVWIEEDRIYKERIMMRKLRQIEEEERRKGKTVRVRFGKIWIEDKWWFWDEEEEILKNREGKRKRNLEQDTMDVE